jgi:large repetitive protein
MKARSTQQSRGIFILPLFFLFILQSLGSYSQTITIDGNPSDWPAVLNAPAIPVKEFVRDANNTNDNQFTGGSSDGDLISNWSWVLGNTNDKGDISNAGAVLIGTNIYFFGDRTAINGDAQIGFWFFLGGVAPSGTGQSNSPFSGTHMVGDILVLSHFTNGGGVVQLEIYEWNGSGLTHLGSTSNATVNSADYPVPAYTDDTYGPWTYTPKSGTGYVTGSFFEGYFDIGTLSTDVCFSSFLLETRNSQSVNASLQDFVAGSFNLKPLPPVTTADSRCGPGTLNLSASGVGTLKWYSDEALTAQVATGTDYSPVLSATATYYVTATNDQGCESDASPVVATVNQFPDASSSPQHVTCFGGTNGEVTITFSGGTGPYMVSFNGGGFVTETSPKTYSGLPAGTYSWIVQDSKLCQQSGSETINEPEEFGLVLTPTNATCYGGAMSISAAVSGSPLADLEINIDGGAFAVVAASPVVFNGLSAGSHTVIVRRVSDNSCMVSESESVSEPDELGLVLTPTHATCYGGAMSISAAVSGSPLADLEINIDGGAFAVVAASPVVFNGLSAGSHTIIVRRVSDNSCQVSSSASVSQPDELGLVLTPTHATCYGGEMSISAAVSGSPLADLEINIDGGAFAVVAASPVVFNGLSAGSHTVIVRRISDNSCMVSESESVSHTDELGLVLTPTHATCYGGAMSISAAVSGSPLSDLEINIDGGAFAVVAASPVVFNGLSAGSHTVIVRRVSDNSCMVSESVSVSEPDELGLVLTPTHATCYGGAMSISAAVSGSPLADLEINIDGGAFAVVAGSPVVFNGLSAGSHTVIVRRISDNSCMVSESESVSEPDELGIAILPTETDPCLPTATGSIAVAVTGSPLSDLEISIDGEPFIPVTDPIMNFTGLDEGPHSVVLRRISDNSCQVSTAPTVEIPEALNCSILFNSEAGCDDTGGSATVTALGGSGTYFYLWDNGETDPTAVNLSSGWHTVTVTDENDCITNCGVEITRAVCGEVYCTYTQGYFGNPRGKSCDGVNGGLSTSQLIENSLAAWGGTLTIGKPGASVFMNNNATDILCIIAKLPGGSGSRELDMGNYGICNLPASYLKKGKINNILLAQTITLGLNMGIKSNLASLELQGGVLATASVDGGCGGTEAVERVCLYDIDGYLTGVENDYQYFSLDPAVIDALGGSKTVSDLFDLANRALANTDGIIGQEDGVSLSAINSAVDAINNAFDECRFFMGFDVPSCPVQKSGQLVPGNQLAAAMSIKVYPNPFKERLTFEFTSETNAHATLEVYNMLGETISVLMNRTVEGGIINRVEYQPVDLAPGVIFYRLILDGKTHIGKAIYYKSY